MTDDRRLRSDERPTKYILFTWLAISALLTVIAWPKISQGRFPGSDDSLRLVQVRDLLAGQGWYDLHQYRIAPPDGVLMHWSRLVDAPLYLSIRALEPLVGQALAEQITVIAIPLLILGLICLLIGRLAWRVFDVETAVFACLAFAMWPLALKQVQPMRIDHHAYQMLCVAIAAWALTWRSGLRGGAAAGVGMGIGAMVSLETLPMAAGFGLVLLIRWLRDPQMRWWLVGYMQGLALTLVILFALTRGLPDLAEHCDVISPAHIGFFLITALATGAIAAPRSLPRAAVLTLFAIAGLGGLIFFGLTAPNCLGSPFGDFDPLVHQFWYQNVLEGQPLWRQTLEDAIPAMAQALVALAASILIFTRQRDWLRHWWGEYSILMLVAIVAGALTFRSFAFVGVLGAVPLGWLTLQMLRRFRSAGSLLAKAGMAVLIYFVLLPSAPFVVMQKLGPSENAASEPLTTLQSSCDIYNNIPLLDRLPPARIVAPFDVGSSVLHLTRHSVVATSHHRAQKPMRDVILTFTSPPEQSRKIINEYGAQYVVVCMDLYEPANFIAIGGDQSLMARLEADDAPGWLERVEIGGPEALRVWKVRPGGIPSPGR